MASKVRVKRPLKFKLDAYRYYVLGNTAAHAFVLAARDNNTTLSGCMTDYASSYMSDDVKNFLRKKIAKKDQEVVQYFIDNDLDLKF
jgi:hypothetical protein